MQVIVKGRHIEVTDSLRRYAEEKVSKLGRYLDKIQGIEVELIVDKNPSVPNPQTAEVTLRTKGPIIRGSVSTENMYASIDGVVDKIERQIERYKGKLYTSHKQAGGLAELALQHSGELVPEQEGEGPRVVKSKRIALKPMTPDEAALQMELLGHDFFVFINSETGDVNVVYKRKDGNYGQIEPIYGKA